MTCCRVVLSHGLLPCCLVARSRQDLSSRLREAEADAANAAAEAAAANATAEAQTHQTEAAEAAAAAARAEASAAREACSAAEARAAEAVESAAATDAACAAKVAFGEGQLRAVHDELAGGLVGKKEGKQAGRVMGLRCCPHGYKS